MAHRVGVFGVNRRRQGADGVQEQLIGFVVNASIPKWSR
jgi:hypothetical protein